MEAFIRKRNETGVLQEMGASVCCECGGVMEVGNRANTCVECLTARIDVTEGLPKSVHVHRCRRCGQYLAGPNQWMHAEVESKELMALCLKKVRGVGKKVKVVDAAWIWTEPHSMRLRMKLTVQKEVMAETILQKSFVVEFVLKNQQCSDCHAQFNNMAWKASVQVRQRVNHKRTFFYLEQVILKKNAQSKAVKIEQFKDGLDFFFAEKNDAVRFSSFLDDCVPCRSKTTKKLVSADLSSNIFHHQYTAIIEVAKACKDDVVLLGAGETRRLGLDTARICLVKSVHKSLKLVDPATGRLADLDSDAYFRSEPDILLTGHHLVDFVVLDVEVVVPSSKPAAPSTKKKTKKRRFRDMEAPRHTAKGFVAEVTLARAVDLGVNDDKRHCVTHLGALLRAGDVVKGYDLATANLTGDLDPTVKHLLQKGTTPDVVLVRKHLPDQHRSFQLHSIDDIAGDGENDPPRRSSDYETFLDQLQSDKDMRSNINLYRSGRVPMALDDNKNDAPVHDPDALDVNELLDDLVIGDDKDDI